MKRTKKMILVAMLSAVCCTNVAAQGHLDDTPTGNYLESVKDVFSQRIITILSVMYNCMSNYL